MKQIDGMNDFPEQERLFKKITGKNFEFFYDKYYAKLIYYVNKMCKDSKKAEDLATESFLIALHKIEKYNPDKSQFSTWLFTVARNHTLQELKKDKKTISMDVTVDDDGTTMKDFIQFDESDDVLMDEIWKRKARIMGDHIDNLKEPFKTVINMREVKGMVYKDIACDLGDDIEILMQSDGCEMKLPYELSKVYSVTDMNGVTVDYRVIEGDTKKTPFFTVIKMPKGEFKVSGRCPKPLSTVKSQIRNGRLKLIDETKREFKELENMYM
jgi:RNA polymerase sigma-70 factor (ECF subfamily)